MEELREKYEQQIELLRQQLSQLQEQLEEEKELLTQRYESERETIEDQLAQQIRDELEVRKNLSHCYGNICFGNVKDPNR